MLKKIKRADEGVREQVEVIRSKVLLNLSLCTRNKLELHTEMEFENKIKRNKQLNLMWDVCGKIKMKNLYINTVCDVRHLQGWARRPGKREDRRLSHTPKIKH